MTGIAPTVLAQLMQARGLSLQDLARASRIDKQTLWRIKEGRTRKARAHTTQQIASALKVSLKVLAGEEPIPAQHQEPDRLTTISQINVRISNQARNALSLIQDRYRVGTSQVLEIAPLLFCWAAEQSLARRRKLLGEFEEANLRARNVANAFRHIILATASSEADEVIEEEQKSIESNDIWGMSIDPINQPSGWFTNPFEEFLEQALAEFDAAIKFENCPYDDYPTYAICMEEAEYLVGGNKELAQRITDGTVALHQMPRELREGWDAAERTKWVQREFEEYKAELHDRVKKSNLIKFPAKDQQTGDSK